MEWLKKMVWVKHVPVGRKDFEEMASLVRNGVSKYLFLPRSVSKELEKAVLYFDYDRKLLLIKKSNSKDAVRLREFNGRKAILFSSFYEMLKLSFGKYPVEYDDYEGGWVVDFGKCYPFPNGSYAVRGFTYCPICGRKSRKIIKNKNFSKEELFVFRSLGVCEDCFNASFLRGVAYKARRGWSHEELFEFVKKDLERRIDEKIKTKEVG